MAYTTTGLGRSWIVAGCLAIGLCLSACTAVVSDPTRPMGRHTPAAMDVAVAVGMDEVRVATSPAAEIEPLAAEAANDGRALRDVVWRTSILTSLAILAILAFGLWAGIRERSYLYLSLTLFAQLVWMASSGGELRLVPGLAALLGDGVRTGQVAALGALLAGFVFMAHYLDLHVRQPWVARVLSGCDIAIVVLLGLVLFTGAPALMAVVHGVLMVGAGTVVWASIRGVRDRQRAAVFLLLSGIPLLASLALGGGEAVGLWAAPDWSVHAIHASLAMAGLMLTVGLTDTMHQLRRDRDHASRLATFDGLTGALARPVIEERLNTLVTQAHASGRPLALVFFDVDRFKRVNDDHGHRVGDSCLRIISMRTRNRLRTYDVFGRWGGDELLVILPDTRLGEALGVAENLRSAVNCRPLSIDGKLFETSLSLGVAELAAGETAEHLLERADAALYASKSAGRDRVTSQAHPRFVDDGADLRRGRVDGPGRDMPDGPSRRSP